MDDLSRGYLSILLEEIALEGLDGITLEGKYSQRDVGEILQDCIISPLLL